MIDLSKYRKGKLVLEQGPVGLKIISDVVDVLLAEGRVHIFDPRGAMRSRMKDPKWDIFYEAKNRVVQKVFPEGVNLSTAMRISNWFDDQGIFPQYDLSEDTKNYPVGHFFLVFPTQAELQARIKKDLGLA